jgi:hypothetical protein
MRDRAVIDSELRLLLSIRQVVSLIENGRRARRT